MADSAIQAYEDAPEKVSAEGPGLLENTIAEYEADADFVAEALAIGVIEQATRIMELRSITRSELADKMGVSRARVAQIFNAPPNLTLRSIASMAIALGTKPYVSLSSVPNFKSD